jgi:hypothetical protein
MGKAAGQNLRRQEGFRRRAHEEYVALGPLGPVELRYIREHAPTRGPGWRGVRHILHSWYGPVAVEAAVAEYRRLTGDTTS